MPDVGPWIRLESFAGGIDTPFFSKSALIAARIDR
jgi:hypothetical protein